jgi:hypothetical protein
MPRPGARKMLKINMLTESDTLVAKLIDLASINMGGYRNRPLSLFQQMMNRNRLSVRARIEHLNASMDSMIGRCIHSIGRLMAMAKIGL